MKKFLVAVITVAMLLMVTSAAFASTQAVDLAKKYVTALENKDWTTAKSISTDAVYCYVSFLQAIDSVENPVTADGVKTFESVVTDSVTGDIEYVRVVYIDNTGAYNVVNVKTNKVGNNYVVVDYKPMGSSWIGGAYYTGYFPQIGEKDNAKVQVLGLFIVGEYILIDMEVTNTAAANSGKNIYVFPSLEAASRVTVNGSENFLYAVAPAKTIEKPLTPGQTMRTIAITYNWLADESLQQNGLTISWSLVVPVGPLSNVIIESGL